MGKEWNGHPGTAFQLTGVKLGPQSLEERKDRVHCKGIRRTGFAVYPWSNAKSKTPPLLPEAQQQQLLGTESGVLEQKKAGESEREAKGHSRGLLINLIEKHGISYWMLANQAYLFEHFLAWQ